MKPPEQLMLDDLLAAHPDVAVLEDFRRLYPDGESTSRIFAVFHQELNRHFIFMNEKRLTNRHFNADDSRQLIRLIEEIDEALLTLHANGIVATLHPNYATVIARCKEFLVASGGSPIPEAFPAIAIVRYEAVLTTTHSTIVLDGQVERAQLTMIGEGAYSHVYKYEDKNYLKTFAVKRAKRNLTATDLARFKLEYETLRQVTNPYVVEVYRYEDDTHQYTMEYCDFTLREYIDRNNHRLTYDTRRRIALQFLYGLNHLHNRKILHRDLSLKNTLIKVYDGAVMVKISDFGLHKREQSPITRTDSEIRGTIVDPILTSFKDYGVANEVYAAGVVLSFIFSGKHGLKACTGNVQVFIERCTANDPKLRPQTVLEIITELEVLTNA